MNSTPTRARRRSKPGRPVSLFLAASLAVAAPGGSGIGPGRAAIAAEAATVRVSNYADFGRITFEFQREVGYKLSRSAGRLILSFEGGDVAFTGGISPPRNAAAIVPSAGGVEIALRPGAKGQVYRSGLQVVVDIHDPTPEEAAAAGAAEGAVVSPDDAPPKRPTARRAEAPPKPVQEQRPPLPSSAGGLLTLQAPEPGRDTGLPPQEQRPDTPPRQAGAPAAQQPAGSTGNGSPPAPANAEPPAARQPLGARNTPERGDASVQSPPVQPRPPEPPVASMTVPPPPPPPTQDRESEKGEASGSADAAAKPPPPTTEVPASITPSTPPPPPNAEVKRPEQGIGGPERRGASMPTLRNPPPRLPSPPAQQEPDAIPVHVVPPSGGSLAAIAVATGESVGAALIRRGDAEVVVLDAAKPLDLSELQGHPAFGSAQMARTPSATALRIPLQAGQSLRASRAGGAWVFDIVAGEPGAGEDAPTAKLERADGVPRLVFPSPKARNTVVLVDPDTGLALLVGTTVDPAPARLRPRRFAQFDIIPSSVGIGILPRVDDIVLRVGQEAFVLGTVGPPGIIIGTEPGKEPPADSAAMTRTFSFPLQPPGALLDLVREQTAIAAATPPLARGPARMETAKTLVALGMGSEAVGMLAVAAADDPSLAADPASAALGAVASLLAGRPDEAGALDDPRLPVTDEVALWRALLANERGEVAKAADGFAATVPLLLAYPEALRQRLLRPAIEALAEAGKVHEAKRLLNVTDEDDAAFAYARARIKEAEGDKEGAVAGYAAAMDAPDRLGRMRAARRSIEMRLSSGGIDAAAAARDYEKLFHAWRGDAFELGIRRRAAELRRQGGDPRGAYDMLSEAETLFPESAAAFKADMIQALVAAIDAGSPSEAVALYDAKAGALPAGPLADAAAAKAAEGLVDLDLPDRASALLRTAAEKASSPLWKSKFGARLAEVRLGEDDAQGALAALAATDTPTIDPGLATRRTIAEARARARTGELQRAAEMLKSAGPAAAEPLADMLAAAQDWKGASDALAQHLEGKLPAGTAPLNDVDRRALARLAAYAALGADDARLAGIKATYGSRMGTGASADAFRLFTSDPVKGVADLPRLQREIEALRGLPRRLGSESASPTRTDR